MLAISTVVREHIIDLRRVLIVDGGYIGLEMAESFRHRGANVTLVEKLPRLLPSMSAVIGDMVVAELQAAGVDIRTGRGLAQVAAAGGTLESGEMIPADLVLLAIGVRPQVELAVHAGVPLGPTGAIAVPRKAGDWRRMNGNAPKRAKGGFATRAIHLGYDPADQFGALAPPVFMTSTYAFATAEEGEALFRGEHEGYVYGRTRNPTQALFEERIASLEGAEAGLAVASGMAAISSTLWTLLQSGDQVVIDHTLYGNSFALFMRGLTRFGVKVAVADFTDLDNVAASLAEGAPKLVFCESPGNPTLRIIDIAAVARMAHQAGALLIVDNTFATPVLQQPTLLGADLVLHSATKFIGGHGDLIAGVMMLGSKSIVENIGATAYATSPAPPSAPLDRLSLAARPEDAGAARGAALRVGAGGRRAAGAASRGQLRSSYPGLPSSPFSRSWRGVR